MADWSELSARLDATVDDTLGDTIQLSLNSGATYTPVKGFVGPFVAGIGIGAMDEPLGSRNRVKLDRSLFGGGLPGRNVRVQHALLGAGTYRPASGEPEEQGRYVLFDVQKVD